MNAWGNLAAAAIGFQVPPVQGAPSTWVRPALELSFQICCTKRERIRKCLLNETHPCPTKWLSENKGIMWFLPTWP